MSFKASLLRLAAASVALVFVAGFWAESAQAQPRYGLSGNARFQIGDGLPIPIGGTPIPDGRVGAVAGAYAKQGAGDDPKSIQLKPGQLTAPGNAIALPVFVNNTNVFQVKTAIPLSFPNATGTLSARRPLGPGPIQQLGRTGYKTVSFCPGDSVEPNGNPGCATGSAGLIDGRMVYSRTKDQFGNPIGDQFGGAMQGNVQGTADVALRAAQGAPCHHTALLGPDAGCLAIFAIANPAGTGAQGAPFGFTAKTAGAAPNPGLFAVKVTAGGKIVSITATGKGAGLPNPATSYGGPWTSGTLTVSQPAAQGNAEVFVLSGSDNRVAGIGSLSLVSGSVSDRGVSGPNANRGWMNLELGLQEIVTPSMSGPGLAAVFGLLALAGGYALWRRRIRS